MYLLFAVENLNLHKNNRFIFIFVVNYSINLKLTIWFEFVRFHEILVNSSQQKIIKAYNNINYKHYSI